MKRSLSGRVVLITGAARGIGEHTARLAAQRGARLSLVGLEPVRLAALADELNSAHSAGTAVWFGADVTDQAVLDQAAADTVEQFGAIDVVVANAGIANFGTVATGDIEALIRTVQVNLVGVMRTVKATTAHVIDARGYFLLVSSTAAFTALPGMSAYCASKAGVEHFGNALRLELAPHGVRVGTAHPAWVDTDLVRDAQHDLPSFRAARDKLPWPVSAITSVDACVEAFVSGIERRKRRIYVPRAIGAIALMRALFTGRISDAIVGREARTLVPQLEAEVAALGRAFGEHSVEAKQ